MLIPHLHFNGSCAEAIALYQRAFGATLDVVFYDDEDDQKRLVEHAEMTIHGQRVMLNDNRSGECRADYPYAQMIVTFPTKEELLQTYDVMIAGSTTVAPLRETDYSPCTVGFWDRYGVRWGFMV